jgi:hypothetical protein
MFSAPSRALALPAVGVALVVATSPAAAGLINNYDFNGNNASLGLSYTTPGSVAGGPSLTVTAHLFNGTNWVSRLVRRSGNALGVDSDPGDGNDGQIGPRVEGLMFDLGSTVFGSFRLDFSLFTGTDDTDIWASTTDIIGNGFVGAMQVADDSTSNPFTSGPLAFRYIFVANTGSVSPTCNATGADCFRVDNLQVVPEPGALPLAGLGLLIAGASMRRRRG